MAANEAAYYTPDDAVDFPYYYTYAGVSAQGTALTNGLNYLNRSKRIQFDSDFVLRAIIGAPTIVNSASGGIQLYNYSQSAAFASPIVPMPNQYAIVPEKIYPRSTDLKFDLIKIALATRACGELPIPVSLLAFQGVKRYWPKQPNYPPGAPALIVPADEASFIRKPYSYSFGLSLNWFYYVTATAGLLSALRTFNIPIQDYDFELHYIEVINVATGAVLTTDLFAMTLYDSTGYRPFSDSPLPQSYWNNNRAAYGGPTMPVPPMLYKVWNNLKFDIQSLVCNTDGSAPYGLQINFCGAQRIPRSTSDPSGAFGGVRL